MVLFVANRVQLLLQVALGSSRANVDNATYNVARALVGGCLRALGARPVTNDPPLISPRRAPSHVRVRVHAHYPQISQGEKKSKTLYTRQARCSRWRVALSSTFGS